MVVIGEKLLHPSSEEELLQIASKGSIPFVAPQ